jgi:cytoskeleton protein RodZ
VDIGIGETLRETRNRRKVGLSDVEAATKIRIRYLRAMENEDWDVLPGGAYTRGFIRAYASYLGLDGERLAEEYRRGSAPEGGSRAPRIEPAATGGGGGGRRGARVSSRALVVVLIAGLLAAAVAIGLLAGGDDGATPGTGLTTDRTTTRDHRDSGQPGGASGVSVQVTAQAQVWICLLDAGGKRLIDGQILEEGAEEGPFGSSGFSVSFGNGEVTLLVDGKKAEIPATPSPLGYRIDAGGALTRLSEAERPTCT